MLAAVQDRTALEKILRHIGLWCESEDIEAIRGPPEGLWPVEPDLATPYDDLPPIDEAAQRPSRARSRGRTRRLCGRICSKH